MWTRKEIKAKARQIMKLHYWTAVAVCFILAVVGSEFSSSTVLSEQYHRSDITTEEVVQPKEKITNWDSLKRALNIKGEPKGVLKDVEKAVETAFNTLTGAQTIVFQFFNTGEKIKLQYTIGEIIVSFSAIAISFMYMLFVSNILSVGRRRFFLEARNERGTKIRRVFFLYTQRSFWNVAKTMFLKSFYQMLWAFTIIGGIYKYYEYRMIPYILAENPSIDRKRAFQLSKEITQGEKWNLFLLDFSFFGWILLEGMTFGLLGIFFVNPYRATTGAEVYVTLSGHTIVGD